MIDNKELTFIRSIDELDFFQYKPSFGRWFFKDWKGYMEDSEKQTNRQRIRMLLEWLWGGYRIYYVSLRDEIVGYVLVAPGGRRLTCSEKDDIVLGPYYILKEKRGLGIMPRILTAVLRDLQIPFKNAYCYIKKSNAASLRAASKCGFEIIGQAEIKGLLRKLYFSESNNSPFYFLMYKKS